VSAAITCLGLTPGDVVLFPSYHCGIELDVLLAHDLSVRFYEVDSNLRVNIESLAPLVDEKVRAVYLIHYFGVPGPAAETAAFCKARGLALLEDCAQALYSRDDVAPIGHRGSIAIYSMRKTLGIPCGGAIVVNDDSYRLPRIVRKPPLVRTLKKTIRLLLLSVGAASLGRRNPSLMPHRLITAPGNRNEDGLGTLATNQRVPPSIRFDQSWRSVSISAVSKWLFRHTRHVNIAQHRRANYAFLLRTVRGIPSVRPLIPDLPAGSCPLLFPLLLEGSRSEFLRFCRARGLEADPHWPHVHPAFRASEFPAAAYLKSHVVALPVHQDLTDGDLAHMSSVLSDWVNTAQGTAEIRDTPSWPCATEAIE
jgi:perosamine synthetase